MPQDQNPYKSPQTPSSEPATAKASLTDRLSAAQNGVIWTIWATYGAFYFCRTNISAANPGMGSPVEEGGLGLSNGEIGWILGSLKIAYAIGQLVNGQLSERLPPRILLAIGMFGSAAMNLCFGLSSGFYFLLFIWACNGFCQSLGWTPCVRVVGNWIPVLWRGKAFGIIGTGYQITLGLTYLVASQAAEHLGWRAAMLIPSAILAVSGIFMLIFVRESPRENDSEKSQRHVPKSAGAGSGSFITNILLTLSNPALWLMGAALGLLNACRYGFLDWGLKHLTEVQQTGVGKAGLKFVVLAGGAAVGSYLAGWATDRFFGSRRGPVICILLVMLGVLTIVYQKMAADSPEGTVVLLFFIGFCIYGPQVLLVGTAPTDLARRGTAAAAAGFVNFMGYIGAFSGDIVTGYFSPRDVAGAAPTADDWQLAIYIWAGWAFLAAIFAALLWNATARESQETRVESREPEKSLDDESYSGS